jgi:threonine-phosphate decarboxylase
MEIRAKSSIEARKPVLHGGLYSKNTSISGILDFSSNLTPLGTPLQIKNAIKKQLKKIENYPDVNYSNLLFALTKYTKLPESNLIVGNGAVEIIYNFCAAFLSKDTPVLIPIPTFGEYEAASKLNTLRILFFKTMDLSKNIDSFISKIPKNGCVFICNPNNPTGKLIPKQFVMQIVNEAKQRNSLVFIDECFIELVPQSNESIIHKVKKFDNVLVLRSLTKSFGLAGIRIGYASSSKYIASVLKKIQIPWSVSSVAEFAGITALDNLHHISRSNSVIKKEYDFLKKTISSINGFECIDSTTNFILIKTKHDSTKLQKKLLGKKILVRDCKNFRGLNEHFIRIAVKSHKDNIKLVKALETIK